jgi:DNA mismatch repair protein HSM3, N terminal domain
MAESSALDMLLGHLKRLQDSSNHEHLDTSLVEHSRLLLQTADFKPSHVVELARLTLHLLVASQDDLEPLVHLLSEAVEFVTFDDLQDSIPVDVVTAGLSSPSPSVQNLALSYLRKAAESPSGAAFVASDDALVKALIKVFLTSKSTEIGGTKALGAFLALLSVDNPDHVTTVSSDGSIGQTNGQGLLWRRVFHDEEVYGLFFRFTTVDEARHEFTMLQITTAQARLLDFVSEVAKISWDAIHDSTKPDPQTSSRARPGACGRERSLLRYGALNMVDRTDPLMKNILLNFLSKILELKSPAGCSGISSIPANSSPSLEFLIASGLHQGTADYYLRSEDFDKYETQFLEAAHIRYFCTYVNLYSEHFLQAAELTRSTINRLNRNLQISRARWAHGSAPVQDLTVLAHVPALVLARASRSGENPLLLLPTDPLNAAALETLGRIFHGPNSGASEGDVDLVADADPFSRGSRAAAARVLFYQYHEKHPEFWSNIGAAMGGGATLQPVSAAIGLVRSILTAIWAPMAENSAEVSGPLSLPTEQSLLELCGGNVSRTGLAEIFNADESVIPSLLLPTISEGRDAEMARLAWHLERERFDLLELISDLMRKGLSKDEIPPQLWQTNGRRIQERIRLGIAGGITAQTSLVGTMGR